MLELSESAVQQSAPEPATTGEFSIGKLAAFIDRSDPGTRAALARLDPDALRPHQIAALSRALIDTGLSPD
ncbi:MAG: hypothetical protein ACK5PF_05995, partial [bacterium]